jgi:hypothetical protein
MTGAPSQLLPGVGKVGRKLEQFAGGAVYEAELNGSSDPAVVEIRPAGTPQATRQLDLWRRCLALAHPNLIKLYAAGESMLAETPVIYLVGERADESLAEVLQERALSEQETIEMLEPLLAVLAWLHRNGFAHTAINPANIRAAGDTLKVSSRTLQPINDGGDPAEDMRSVGVLLRNALAREISTISEPLLGIILRTSEVDRTEGWTAEQALAHLSSKTTVPPPSTNRRWIYGALAALLLSAGAIGLIKKNEPAQPVGPPPQQKAAPVSSVAPTPPPAPATQPAHPIPKSRNRRAEGWTVVVASYADRGRAGERAAELSKRWPAFHVEVFQPPLQQTRYLVVIGKNLSEDRAEALRQRAHREGLAGDAYIKRFD